jgi:hypothetical protein
VAITTLVRPHIGESPALESDHHFRQSFVWNSKHDRVSINRSRRRLGGVKPQPKLAKYFLYGWGLFVTLGPVHDHDRVSQS